MAALIVSQRVEHFVPHAVSCRALGVSQAWFYKWRRGDCSLRRKHRAVLAAQIDYLFAKHNGTYGSPRITADLQELGYRVSVNTVAQGDGREGPGGPAPTPAAVDHPVGPLRPQGTGRGEQGLHPPGAAGCDLVR